MIRHATSCSIGVCAVGIALSAAATAADVYRSEGPNGTVRYASQALDSSYVLFLQGEPPPTKGSILVNNSKRAAAKLARQATLEPLIQQLAQKYAIDSTLVRAIIDVESQFDPQVRSAKGAVGAMQLMPATAVRYGASNSVDPAQNIEAGIRYLKDLLALHNGNVVLALASYNAGEGAVAKHGNRIPPYKETMLYVPAVLAKQQAASPLATTQ